MVGIILQVVALVILSWGFGYKAGALRERERWSTMNYETKQDVFDKALREWDNLVHSCGLQGEEAHGGCEFDPILIKYKKDYDAALPDNLPVIPKAVGEILQSAYGQTNLLGVLDTAKNGYKVSKTLAWIIANQNTFACAWVLGVWEVEETGEIVKLEDEK